ncbi:MAG: hypothetical protein AAFY11_09305 [Cyanobacteria bacterium J06641_5]
MHVIRWVLAIGWLGLISSLLVGNFTGIAFLEWAHSRGTSIFWGTIVPAAIAILLVFGHEGWRRICPLGFLSQISQRLGIRAAKRIEEDSWLGTYHLYVQCGLLFLGLSLRLLWCNGSPVALGLLCSTTILAAILVGYRYGGRSWCHYFCPMSPVQTAISGPRGLFSSAAHTAPPMSLTQSKCRIWDNAQGKEVSACVTCKSPCVDIDAEQTYWEELLKPGRQFLQYGYLGLVIGFFGYFLLYYGGWDYYYEGMLYGLREAGNLLSPGFFFIDIPRVAAVPLTLALSALITTSLGCYIEKLYKGYLLRNARNLAILEAEIRERARHRIFCVFTAIAFNAFFAFGWRTLIGPDSILHHGLTLAATLPSAWWLYRNFNRDRARYNLEGETMTLRRQIKKLPIDLSEHLGQRSIEDLRPEELDLLANILPQINRGSALQLFTGLVEELADKGWSNPQENWAWLDRVQTRLGIDDEDREQALKVVGLTRPNLLRALSQNSDNDRTLRLRAQQSRRASRAKSTRKPRQSVAPAARKAQDAPRNRRDTSPAKGPIGEGARIAAQLNRDFLTSPSPANSPANSPSNQKTGSTPQSYNPGALPTPSGSLAGGSQTAPKTPSPSSPPQRDEWTQQPAQRMNHNSQGTERETRQSGAKRADALRHLSRRDKVRNNAREGWSGLDSVLSRLGIDRGTREQVRKAVDGSQPKPSRSLQPPSSDSSRTLAYQAQPSRRSSPATRAAQSDTAMPSDRLQSRERRAFKVDGQTGKINQPQAERKSPPLPPTPSFNDRKEPSNEIFESHKTERTRARASGKSRGDRAGASHRSTNSNSESKTVARRAGMPAMGPRQAANTKAVNGDALDAENPQVPTRTPQAPGSRRISGQTSSAPSKH